ncbi:hypothetical protein Avbf_13345 [Armadillidium vulgare]|nr:hypothetical protein Avbf_13345 [Armadillidium vulgare]
MGSYLIDIQLNYIKFILGFYIFYRNIKRWDVVCREPRRGEDNKLYRSNKKINYNFSSYKTRGSSFLFLVFMGRQ